MVKVRTPATRVPGFCSRSFQPRSIPISNPQASAVAIDSACQYQLAFTTAEAHELLVERGAKTVYAAVSHGVFSEGSMERIDTIPIQRLLVTDSIETQPVRFSPKVEVVSVAPLFGEAIRRIHNRESISVLFPE